jgi:hypothetical protein
MNNLKDLPNSDVAQKILNGRASAYQSMTGKDFADALKKGRRWFARVGGVNLADKNTPRGFSTRAEAIEYAKKCKAETARIYLE